MATPLDLSDVLNCTGVTADSALGSGAFNIWSNTFPAEELPRRGADVLVEGIPFRFVAQGSTEADHVRCARQMLAVPEGRYDWIYVLAAAERRTEDELVLHFADGTIDPEWLRVSDFWPETPARFGDSAAFPCTRLHYPRHVQPNMGPVIWRQRTAVPREQDLAAIRLPDNPAIHIFALTLVSVAFEGAEYGSERVA